MTFIIWGIIGLTMAAIDYIVAEDIENSSHKEYHLGAGETLRKMFSSTDRRTLVITLGVVILSGMLWTGVSSFIMAFIEEQKGISFVIAGGLSTLKYTVGAFAMIVGGELSDKLGRKRLLLFGYAGFALSLFGFVLSPSSLPVLGLIVVILGFTFFITQSPMNALLGDLAQKDTVGVTYGVNFTLKYGIGFFTPAIAGFLALNYGYASVFYFFAALSTLAFGLTMLIRERKIRAPK
jgi:MFS family permease